MSVYLTDVFRNLATGLGTTAERATQGEWCGEHYNRQPLLESYNLDWLAARVVDVPADEIRRCWRKVTTPSMTPDQIAQFECAEKRVRLKMKIAKSKKWARLFGGGGVYVATPQNPETPLAPGSLAQGTELNLIVFDRDELSPESIYSSEQSALFAEPAVYNVVRTSVKIHASRFIRFDGRELPRELFERNGYWGGSHLKPLLGDIERCATVTRALAQLADEANVDVLGIPELFSKIANTQTLADLQTRISEGTIIKTLYKVMLRDVNEEYTRNELSGSLAGLVELLKAYYELPSAGSGIPVTKLLGISPGGLNATGESDLENYYDMIDVDREGSVTDALDAIDPLICMTEFGRTFDDWSYEWAPLWQEDRAEKVVADKARVDTIIQLRDVGIITPSIAAEQLLTDGMFSAIAPEYIEDLKAIEAPDEDDDASSGEKSDNELDAFGGAESDGENVQQQVLNGAQVSSLVDIAVKVKQSELERNQALGVISVAFPTITAHQANAIVSPEDIDEPKQPSIDNDNDNDNDNNSKESDEDDSDTDETDK